MSGDLCQAGACHGTRAVLHDSKAGCCRAAVVDVLHPPVHQLLVGASIHSLSRRVQRNPGSVAVHALQQQACRHLLRRPSAVLQEGRGGEGGLVQAVVASTVTAAQGGVERPWSGTLATPVALATLPADSASGLGEEVLLLEKAPASRLRPAAELSQGDIAVVVPAKPHGLHFCGRIGLLRQMQAFLDVRAVHLPRSYPAPGRPRWPFSARRLLLGHESSRTLEALALQPGHGRRARRCLGPAKLHTLAAPAAEHAPIAPAQVSTSRPGPELLKHVSAADTCTPPDISTLSRAESCCTSCCASLAQSAEVLPTCPSDTELRPSRDGGLPRSETSVSRRGELVLQTSPCECSGSVGKPTQPQELKARQPARPVTVRTVRVDAATGSPLALAPLRAAPGCSACCEQVRRPCLRFVLRPLLSTMLQPVPRQEVFHRIFCPQVSWKK